MQSSGCGQLNLLCVELFYRKYVMQCFTKIRHGIGKRKNTTTKFNGQVTCFISLARHSLAIAREVPASETILYSVVGHHGSILLQLHVHVQGARSPETVPYTWSLLQKLSTIKQQPKQPACLKLQVGLTHLAGV